ncbi:hypothetical protein [Croceicoccus marinus]|jgi:hypothetical protein|uniref:Uncharacterized protein n=1 Tax=Croceicoccus marinus TaxID=450378 RepID=A0A7G6VQI8_9SPHN|nr:hypothetical protein [Croceicoccus marinus]QNE04003.1 hypothetical protein H4O24_08185 [Croceicoccus marinus]
MTPTRKSSPAPVDTLSSAQRESLAAGAMRRCWAITGTMIAASGLFLAAACAPTRPAPAPVPAPAPTPAPTTTPAPVTPQHSIANWADVPVTPGTWTYRADGDVTRALFGTTQGGAQFTMACEKGSRQIRLWRAGSPASAAQTGMTIATTSDTRTVPAAVQAGQMPQLVASLSPGDSLIDAIVFSRGHFAVGVSGLPLLVMPSWGEVARVAQDCR